MTRIAAAARVVRDTARVTPRTIAGIGAAITLIISSSATSATTAIIIDSILMIAIAIIAAARVKRHCILLQVHTQLILLHALGVRVLVRARQSLGRGSLRRLVAEVRGGGLNDQRGRRW